MAEFAVRDAGESDLPFVMALQRANRESVGGLPSPAIEERLRRGTVLLGMLNGDPCGYLLFDYRGGIVRIPQACIQYDARRRKYGAALVIRLHELHPDADELRLRCAADLEANVFWRDMGFSCVGSVAGGSRRGRTLNLWQRWLTPRLLSVAEIAAPPTAELRVDCRYDETDFLDSAPEGFRELVTLPKMAWANRKSPIPFHQ